MSKVNLNAEILRASGLVDSERIEHGSPLRLSGYPTNGMQMDFEGWPGIQPQVTIISQEFLTPFLLFCKSC